METPCTGIPKNCTDAEFQYIPVIFQWYFKLQVKKFSKNYWHFLNSTKSHNLSESTWKDRCAFDIQIALIKIQASVGVHCAESSWVLGSWCQQWDRADVWVANPGIPLAQLQRILLAWKGTDPPGRKNCPEFANNAQFLNLIGHFTHSKHPTTRINHSCCKSGDFFQT